MSEYWCNFRKKCTKRLSGFLNIKIGVWNLQSLNLDINNRYLKIEFLRDTLINNKLDFLFLIDVNYTDSLILNGYAKYTDGRNILFVKDEVVDKFETSNYIFYNTNNKLAFVYLPPNSKDDTLINNINILIRNKYTVIGDLNVKSNKKLTYFDHFTGEDSLQIGAISPDFVRTFSIAAPSDHRFVLFETKKFINFARSLKLGEISYDNSKEFVFDILKGKNPIPEPKISVRQYHVGLNDREQSINAMLDDFLNNNVKKLFHRYNYLWKFDKREPFLGKKVPKLVIKTYAEHLRANKDKSYEKIEKVEYNPANLFSDILVKKTNSRALNFEFIALRNIPKILNEFLSDPNNNNIDIINNIISYANKNIDSIISEVFFLQKSPIVKDFNDVRVIIIIPTIIKMYECLVFDKIVDFLSELISKSAYQFGGVRGGSTYEAMLKIKMIQKKFPDASGIVLMDMSKGYDTVNLSILEECINKKIWNPEIRRLALVWLKLVKAMDISANDEIIKRTRGLPMGLSLSPIFFALYVDFALEEIDKTRIAMYLDDLAFVLRKGDAEGDFEELKKIINAFEKCELTINTKKTLYITDDKELDEKLATRFKKVDSANYLGRLISLNGDGKIAPDNRFYNLKGLRSNSLPFWSTFFVKRIIFNSALDAKLRFRLLMWSTDDIVIRTAIWRNNWAFFRKSMGQFSYTQLSFCIFNIFRYFIDIMDIIRWRDLHNNGTSDDTIFKLIKEKIITKDIKRVNEAIDIMKFEWDWTSTNNENEFHYAKRFINHLWNQFLKALIIKYNSYKREKNESAYLNIEKFMKSKLFKCFGILHNIAFVHFIPKDNRKKEICRNKDLFILTICKALLLAVSKAIDDVKKNKINNLKSFNINYINSFININFPNNIISSDTNTWESFLKDELKALWPLLDSLLELLDLYKLKGKVDEASLNESIFSDKDRIALFVDGSFSDNIGGWGYAVYDYNNKELFHSFGKIPENLTHLKNVAGELIATLNALITAEANDYKKVTICFDYTGIFNYYNGNWIPSDPFIKDYVLKMKNFEKKIDMKFIKVPSHTGILGNEMADYYAKCGANIPSTNNNYKTKPLYSEKQIALFKELYKFIFKYLTIAENIYLNANLNDLDLDYLILNLTIKYFNLEDFANKQYNISEMEGYLDPLEDNFFDILV